MKSKEMKSNAILLLTAMIWGFAFVAQSIGMKYVETFTFNGVRFALGGVSLIPLIVYFNKKKVVEPEKKETESAIVPGLIAGTVLFLAASLQQAGLAYTSAGKAAFITGLYIVIVPLLGIFLKQRITVNAWIGVLLAVTGLYFLSINDDFSIGKGDLLEIAGAFFWAIHILAIDHFTKKTEALKLSLTQFLVCSGLSMIVAFLFEDISIAGISKAAIPILYGGLLSVGVAYTLQAVAQKNAKPAHAAIILSMETVFASLGGALILKEFLGGKEYFGCLLMLFGMLLTQIKFPQKKKLADT